MIDKRVALADAARHLKDGMTVMVGGFLGTGSPAALIDELIAREIKNITLIANDTAFADVGIGRLIANRQVKKVIASHIGTNGETGKQLLANELEVELVPQGTLAERIRCGGAGLGGVLTPTGVGTVVEEGKQLIFSNGREYLLEMPLRADLALIQAQCGDRSGNLVYDKAARNFNPLMAMAADVVIAEVAELLPNGSYIEPDRVMTPGIVVDHIVCEGGC